MLVFELSRPAMAMNQNGDNRNIPQDPEGCTKILARPDRSTAMTAVDFFEPRLRFGRERRYSYKPA
jgi:hypothetical protein